MASDDDIYDDVLEESFDFDDEDYDDLDLNDDIDGDHYDEFGVDENEIGSEDNTDLSSRKGFALDFNTIVIIGAVVVGGIIMMYQITSKKPAPKAAGQEKFATALQMNGAFEGPGAISNDIVPVSEKEDEQDGFLFDSESIDGPVDVPAEIEDNDLPMPSPITVSSDNVLQVSQEELEIITSNDVEDVKIDEDVQAVAESETVFIAEPEVDLVTEIVDAEPVVLEEPKIDEVETETVEMDSVKLKALLSRVEAMERQMSEVQQSHNAEIKSMEAQIEALKKERSSVIKSKSNSDKIQHPKAVKATVSVKKRWELRAAQPGRAWVSLRGQKNMRPIVVGDQLSGIGRIQNIVYTNGRWVVQGSTGQITQ